MQSLETKSSRPRRDEVSRLHHWSLELKIGSLESEKVIIGSLESERKLGP